MNEKHDRRSSSDRRQVDLDTPLGKERRRRVEQRKPELLETEMSESDWALYFGNRSKKAENTVSEEAADIFDRIRN